MTEDVAPRQRVDALVRRQPPGEGHGVVEVLHRLCCAVSGDLALMGAAVTLLPGVGAHVVSAASSAIARQLEETQFGVGEGPTRAAFISRRPVLIADLQDVGPLLWPGWMPSALSAGVRAVYAFPLHVGASIFGVLTLHADVARGLDTGRLQTALLFSEVATEVLLDASTAGDGAVLHSHLDATLDTHAHIYQAQGMVMVDLGITLPEALARMRARAWATGQDLWVLAGEIVAGRATLPRDDL